MLWFRCFFSLPLLFLSYLLLISCPMFAVLSWKILGIILIVSLLLAMSFRYVFLCCPWFPPGFQGWWISPTLPANSPNSFARPHPKYSKRKTTSGDTTALGPSQGRLSVKSSMRSHKNVQYQWCPFRNPRFLHVYGLYIYIYIYTYIYIYIHIYIYISNLSIEGLKPGFRGSKRVGFDWKLVKETHIPTTCTTRSEFHSAVQLTSVYIYIYKYIWWFP